MDKFLPHEDEPGRLINTCAADLFTRLQQIDADTLGLPEHCLYYYKASHSRRLFFSIETSAHLLYNALRLSGKPVNETVIMDYGAGVGTLYLLAKLIGCKKVIYNDHLRDWQFSAELIAKAAGIQVDHYIVGDIHDSVDQLKKLGIQCHIITSRNVVEHIYKLDEFFDAIFRKQRGAIIYSSTTANKSNPAAALKHVWWHRKWEKVYRGKRLQLIKRAADTLSHKQAMRLAIATRGLAAEDLAEAIGEFVAIGKMPDPSVHGTNTCDPENGVWAEHLLSLEEYKELIDEDRYNVRFEPGFWDTHYSKGYKNVASKILNGLIRSNRTLGMQLAPFMYVIADPRKKDRQ